MILDPRARQLPDESVVMRYPTRAYQTDQPSACRPFCYQHIVRTRILYKPLDRSNTYQCPELEIRRQNRLTLARMSSADLVQLKGLGSVLLIWMYWRIACSSCRVER
jgi:hypothetical protein